jgi:glycosyltransferase involved in cell wall biosynthesis
MLRGKEVSVIVPCYNEARNVEGVLKPLLTVDWIDEVLVVDDGSRDGTPEIVAKYPVKLVELGENLGKSCAVGEGVKASRGELLLFLDADLIGLREDHLLALVEPLFKGAVMVVGRFKEGRKRTDFAQRVAPGLSGQRAVWRWAIEDFDFYKPGYSLEVRLNKWMRMKGYRVELVDLVGLAQITKEEKVGVLRGLCKRMAMYWDILSAAVRGGR